MTSKWTHIRGLKLFAGVLLFTIIIDFSGIYCYYQMVLSFADHQPEVSHADTGIIFFGDYHPDEQHLGSDSKKRANVAIQLFEAGKIQYIIAIGGFNYKNRKVDRHLMSEYLIAHGIPDKVIYYDTLSYNTITNWQEAKKIMEIEDFKSAVAISSPLHIYRIADMINEPDITYATYHYQFNHFNDYYTLYKNVHHEWKSLTLSFLFEESLRNKISYVVRNTVGDIKDFFRGEN